jgi:hypothetical protein
LRTRRVAETATTQATASIGDVAVDDSYVSQSDWVAPLGRADLIDPVADEHERRPNGRHPTSTPQDEITG